MANAKGLALLLAAVVAVSVANRVEKVPEAICPYAVGRVAA